MGGVCLGHGVGVVTNAGPGMEGDPTAGWYEQGVWTQTQELNTSSGSSSDKRPTVSVLVCPLGTAGRPAGPGGRPDTRHGAHPPQVLARGTGLRLFTQLSLS